MERLFDKRETGINFQSFSSKEFELDTKGVCFLCLNEISEEETEDSNSESYSLRNVCRYLKINCSGIIERNVKGGQGNNNRDLDSTVSEAKKKCDFSVTLCSACTLEARKLTDLIAQLERVQMLVNYQLQEFSQKFTSGEDDGENGVNSKWITVKAKMTKEGGNSVESQIVEDLRQIINQKGADKIKAATSPKVVLDPLCPVNMEPAIGNPSGNLNLHGPTVISGSHLQCSSNSGEDSFSNFPSVMHHLTENETTSNNSFTSQILTQLTKQKGTENIKGNIPPQFVLTPVYEPAVDKAIGILRDPIVISPSHQCPSTSGEAPGIFPTVVVDNQTENEATSNNSCGPQILKNGGPPKLQRSHQTVHKIWICDPADEGCGTICTRKANLLRHQEKHCPGPGGRIQSNNYKMGKPRREKKKFICDQEDGGCGKPFTSRCNMEYHRRHHCPRGEVKILWKCLEAEGGCGKVFSGKHILQRHKENYCAGLNKDSFECSLREGGCGRNFSSLIGLERHQNKSCPRNRAEDVWTCDLGDGQCGVKCTSEAGLIRHQKFKCPFRINLLKEGESRGDTDFLEGSSFPMMEQPLVDPLEIQSSFEPSKEPEVKGIFS